MFGVKNVLNVFLNSASLAVGLYFLKCSLKESKEKSSGNQELTPFIVKIYNQQSTAAGIVGFEEPTKNKDASEPSLFFEVSTT